MHILTRKNHKKGDENHHFKERYIIQKRLKLIEFAITFDLNNTNKLNHVAMEKNTTQQPLVKKGQILTESQLLSYGIKATNIDCFQFSHFVLYAQSDKRIILQPLPHDQYKVIRVYDYIEAGTSAYVG